MTMNELKKKYMDKELAHLVCEHLKKDGKAAMHLYVTMAGLVGCSIGAKSSDQAQLANLINICGELCADAATTTFERRQKPGSKLQ